MPITNSRIVFLCELPQIKTKVLHSYIVSNKKVWAFRALCFAFYSRIRGVFAPSVREVNSSQAKALPSVLLAISLQMWRSG